MIAALVTVMMCSSGGAITTFEVPGAPVLRHGSYMFKDLGVSFSSRTCWIEITDEEVPDAVQ